MLKEGWGCRGKERVCFGRVLGLFLSGIGMVIVLPALPAHAATPVFSQVVEGTLDGQYGFIYNGGQLQPYPAFGDTDGDGDLDMFIASWITLQQFRNDGTSLSATWTPISREALGLSRSDHQLCVAMCDIDADGDADVFVSTWEKKVYFFRAEAGGFTQVTNAFVSLSMMGGGNNKSYLEFADLDTDGDFDLLVGYLAGPGYSAADAGTVLYFRNDGTPTSPVFTSLGGVLGIDVRPRDNVWPCAVDLDGDGDLDILAGNSGEYRDQGLFGLARFENIGTPSAPSFAKREGDYFGLGYTAALRAADLDGDGDQDLVVSQLDVTSRIRSVLRNVGTPQAPVWNADRNLLPQIENARSSPELVDIDNDGDLDLFTGGVYEIAFTENIGSATTPIWATRTEDYIDIPASVFSGSQYNAYGALPAFCDIDADGDSDLFLFIFVYVGNSKVVFFENIGTPETAVWSQDNMTDGWQGIGIYDGYYNTLDFGDLDSDGDFDILSTGNRGSGEVRYYENLGDAQNPQFSGFINLLTPSYPGSSSWKLARPAFSDMDADGDLDILVAADYVSGANGASWINYFENVGTPSAYSFSPTPTASNVLPFSLVDNGVTTTGDLNGDGHDDFFCSDAYGGLMYFAQVADSLSISPGERTVLQGATLPLSAQGATGTVTWSLRENRSGGSIDPGTGVFTAGASGTGLDVIEAVDSGTGLRGLAYVNAIDPAEVGGTGHVIIVAGKRDVNDYLWDATNFLSQQAYRTCLLKGYAKDQILFLNPDTAQDVDGNGELDDIDAASTLQAVQNGLAAIPLASPSLTLYLVDHGLNVSGLAGFYPNESEILDAFTLGGWLDALQAGSDARVTVIIDTCYAEGFFQDLHPPVGKERILVGSSTTEGLAYFLGGGTISFSAAFWDSIHSGYDVGTAFDLAKSAMNTYQSPQLDDTGDGVYDDGVDGALARQTYIGLSYIAGADRPQLGQVVGNQTLSGGTTATLWVKEVASTYPLSETGAVRATIVPPDFHPDPGVPDPIVTLPSVALLYNGANSRYEVDYDQFGDAGTYKVILTAEDIWQSVSFPKQVYVHQRDTNEHVILVVADGPYNGTESWNTSNFLGNYAYRTLQARWLTHDHITYLNGDTDQDVDGNGLSDEVDGLPTKANLSAALAAQTALGASAGKLTVYLIGNGDASGFHVNVGETVTGPELDTMLDAFQAASGRDAYLVGDFSESELIFGVPPEGSSRIQMASAGVGQECHAYLGGVMSFSRLFLNKVFSGTDLRNGFKTAQSAWRLIFGPSVRVVLDDNGNGIGNEKSDGIYARTAYLGIPFLTGGAELPIVSSLSGTVEIPVDTAYLLWAEHITDPSGILEVRSLVLDAAGTEMDQRVLSFSPSAGRFEALHPGLPAGVYTASVIATAVSGLRSDPVMTTINVGGATHADAVWVDFGWTGFEDGSYGAPFNTVLEGLNAAESGGTLRAFAGSTGETPEISTPVRIESAGGAVRIGD